MDFHDTSTFALPVLFMRSPTGIIFDLDLPRKANTLILPIGAIHRLKDIKKDLSENVDLLEKIEKGVSDQTKTEIDQQKIQISKIQNRLRNNYLMIGLMLAATGVIFFASRIGIFNILRLDDWTERVFIHSLAHR